jgi:hypothetical protein
MPFFQSGALEERTGTSLKHHQKDLFWLRLPQDSVKIAMFHRTSFIVKIAETGQPL